MFFNNLNQLNINLFFLPHKVSYFKQITELKTLPTRLQFRIFAS